jgi:lipopolysaccharide/colanic/teichoic acid biosynthesis glycosyltransferase
MIRLFNVYYSTRTLMLLVCEALLVGGSFLLAASYIIGPDTYIALFYNNGLLKIGAITLLTLLLSYYFDLYEPQRMSERWEIYFRLLLVLSVLSFILAGLMYFIADTYIGPQVFTVGISILAVVLVLWRRAYEWIIGLSLFRERVYVLGNGARARHIVETLRRRRDAGMEVVDGLDQDNPTDQLEHFAADLRAFRKPKARIDRIIVAMEDRRGAMPVRELLDLRLNGVIVEDASALMERLSGKLPLAGLNPSTLIFTQGFNVKASQQIFRRLVSITVSAIGLAICLPFIPFIILAVRLSSPGPIFFLQTRVGLRGRHFSVIKFRTMRQDAEAGGAVWATKNDPRVTPRPERPEFVQWLSSEIPFYELRHMIRPGITGWAQVRYQYGASLEETKQKLEYDLYYVKHLSVGLDLLIMFETIKTIILRRGAQ